MPLGMPLGTLSNLAQKARNEIRTNAFCAKLEVVLVPKGLLGLAAAPASAPPKAEKHI